MKIRNENENGAQQCISNGGQSAINETNMNNINDSAKMNRCAEKPATAHTLDRWNEEKEM